MPHPSGTLFNWIYEARCIWGCLRSSFVFLFVDLFDNVGTLVGVCEQAGFVKDGKIPRVGRILLADGVGTVFGSLTGTSTVTSYIESAAGVAAGARTGLSNVFVAALFLAAMFCAPDCVRDPWICDRPGPDPCRSIDDAIDCPGQVGGFHRSVSCIYDRCGDAIDV